MGSDDASHKEKRGNTSKIKEYSYQVKYVGDDKGDVGGTFIILVMLMLQKVHT